MGTSHSQFDGVVADLKKYLSLLTEADSDTKCNFDQLATSHWDIRADCY